MKLKVEQGEPPVGYSFVGLWDEEAGAQKWYAAAQKAKDTKSYKLMFNHGSYILWVMKPKGKGKMMGTGLKVKSCQER